MVQPLAGLQDDSLSWPNDLEKPMEVFLATENEWKVKIAKRVIEQQYGVAVKPRNLNLAEPQCDNPVQIAKASVEEAYKLLSAPVVKCDSGLRIPALKGFPGPYSHYVERTLGVEGLLRVCDGLETREAAIYSVVAFCDKRLEPVTFYGETRGRLLEEKRGEHGYFFDFIFVPEGQRESMAEFDDAERWRFWAGPYKEFAEWYRASQPMF